MMENEWAEAAEERSFSPEAAAFERADRLKMLSNFEKVDVVDRSHEADEAQTSVAIAESNADVVDEGLQHTERDVLQVPATASREDEIAAKPRDVNRVDPNEAEPYRASREAVTSTAAEQANIEAWLEASDRSDPREVQAYEAEKVARALQVTNRVDPFEADMAEASRTTQIEEAIAKSDVLQEPHAAEREIESSAQEQPDETEKKAESSEPTTSHFTEEQWERLQSIQGLSEAEWQAANDETRQATLIQLDAELAAIQGRSRVPIHFEKMDPSIGGYYNGEMHLNSLLLGKDARAEAIETIAHEGRHAYQHYCIMHPGHHDDATEVQRWAENWPNRVVPGDILNGKEVTDEEYRNQPTEIDSRGYHKDVAFILLGAVRAR